MTPKSRLYTGLLLLVIFVLGMVTGAGVTYSLSARRLGRMFDRSDLPPEPGEIIADRLDLDAEQREKLKQIITRRRPEMIAIRRSLEPQISALREAQRTEIRAILTPDQQSKFDRIFAEMEARRKAMLGP